LNNDDKAGASPKAEPRGKCKYQREPGSTEKNEMAF
jgi:hypothetical protein